MDVTNHTRRNKGLWSTQKSREKTSTSVDREKGQELMIVSAVKAGDCSLLGLMIDAFPKPRQREPFYGEEGEPRIFEKRYKGDIKQANNK